MEVTCVSDLHGHYPKLDGGDLLIVAGDLMATDSSKELSYFLDWLESQKYDRLVFIGGNHDNQLVQWISTEQSERMMANDEYHKWEYLIDSGTEFEGLKIWGSPWTLRFEGMNPLCKAFTCGTEQELGEKFDLIPDDTDILITHSPPFNILDDVERWDKGCIESVGSTSLRNAIERVKPRLHVFGHIHEHGGKQEVHHYQGRDILCVNASHVNERYWPVNKPVRIIL